MLFLARTLSIVLWTNISFFRQQNSDGSGYYLQFASRIPIRIFSVFYCEMLMRWFYDPCVIHSINFEFWIFHILHFCAPREIGSCIILNMDLSCCFMIPVLFTQLITNFKFWILNFEFRNFHTLFYQFEIGLCPERDGCTILSMDLLCCFMIPVLFILKLKNWKNLSETASRNISSHQLLFCHPRG